MTVMLQRCAGAFMALASAILPATAVSPPFVDQSQQDAADALLDAIAYEQRCGRVESTDMFGPRIVDRLLAQGILMKEIEAYFATQHESVKTRYSTLPPDEACKLGMTKYGPEGIKLPGILYFKGDKPLRAK
jgi:hypothetical protein